MADGFEELYGYIEVSVLTGIIIAPINNARVDIYSVNEEGDTDGAYLASSGYTDRGGRAGPFRVIAGNDNYNSNGGDTKVIKRYDIRVSADGFYSSVRTGTPVFPGIVSVEYFNLVPRAETIGASGTIDQTKYDRRETTDENDASSS